jgi:hypothetical protein
MASMMKVDSLTVHGNIVLIMVLVVIIMIHSEEAWGGEAGKTTDMIHQHSSTAFWSWSRSFICTPTTTVLCVSRRVCSTQSSDTEMACSSRPLFFALWSVSWPVYLCTYLG